MKLQLFLSHNGVCSRRKALETIKNGYVSVNGTVVLEPSTQVNEKKDTVRVGGVLVADKKFEYLVLNKPSGHVTTTTSQFGQRTVLSLLPKQHQHLKPVGRLDKDTEGVLLFTNDGDVAYRLTHPKHDIDKVYFVKIEGEIKNKDIEALKSGIVIEGKKTAPAKVSRPKIAAGKTSFVMTIHEGRKRQIRLMLKAVGHDVIYLKRVAHGPIQLGELPLGSTRALTQQEVHMIKKIQAK